LVLQSQYGGLKSRAMGPGGMMDAGAIQAAAAEAAASLRGFYQVSLKGALCA